MRHSSVSWEVTLLYFLAETLYDLDRRSPSKWKLEISPNLYFDRLLLLKICKISAKIVQRSYVSWHWRVMQNLKKQWFAVLKMTRIRWFLTGALKSLKNLHFDWSLFCKVHDFWAKNSSKELSFMIQESDAKFEEKLTCGVENDKEFGKFSPGHSKASKLRIWWDPFIQSRTCMSLKFTGELSFMTMKNNAKFGEELTYQFKIGMRNLTNFDLSTQKSQKVAL